MPSDHATCTYCGQTGLADWVKRRECCALAKKRQDDDYSKHFTKYAVEWLNDNLTVGSILNTPGVIELLMAAHKDEIQVDFDENSDEACCECGRLKQDCAKADDPSYQHGDRDEEEPDYDEEYEERKRIVREVSCKVDGLTSSEVRDIMNDY